ncbi:MAG: Ig-like domain-containing protein [Leptospiraceae bacterium]|nr:Ig-like domain-containing protein [Leptospiraceae bacterium]
MLIAFAPACVDSYPNGGYDGLFILLLTSNSFRIESTSPANNATDVAVNSKIRISFNDTVNTASLSYNSLAGTCGGSIQLSNDNFANCHGLSLNTSNNPLIEFTPNGLLAANTGYKLYIDSSVSGTDGSVLGSATTVSFVTGNAIDTTPPADVTGMAATPQASGAIQLNWTNPVDVDFSATKVLRVNGATCTTNPNDGTATVVYNGPVNSALDSATTHGQQYCYTAFAYDTSTNYAPGGVTGQATATANDSTAPGVSSVSPSGGTANVATNQTVQVQFSEAMNNGTFSLDTSDGACTGSVQLREGPAFTMCKGITISTGDNITYTFTPASPANMKDSTEYRLYVQAGVQDAAGNGIAGAPVIQSPGFTTGDFTAPTISSVTSTTANGTYGIGSVVNVQVTFNENIAVAGGTPYITLETGASDVSASFTSVTGGNTMNFSFTVAAGHVSSDLDYVTNPINLNGATIQDGAGNNADLLSIPAPGAAGSLSQNKNLVIDGIAPTIQNITSSSANNTYTVGQVITIQIVYSEPITVNTVGGTPTLTLETGATDAVVNYTTVSGGNTVEFNYTVGAGHSSADLDYKDTSSLQLNSGTISDGANNAAVITLPYAPGAGVVGNGSLSVNKNIVVDGTTVTSKLPDTGQTVCYWDNVGTWTPDPTCSAGTYLPGNATYPYGQDAHYSDTPAAFSLAPSNGNTTVTEATSGLTYENGAGTSGVVDAPTAATYCSGLGTAALTWRLPTTRELIMHYDLNASNPALNTSVNFFNGAGASTFIWTADASGLVGGEQFNIANNYPRIQDDPIASAGRQARCVTGPAYPAPSYTTQNSGADYMVFDATSNLTWTKCSINAGGTVLDAGGGTCTLPMPATHDMNWKTALQVCENLSYGTHGDWRLPNFRELLSIVEWTNGPPALINTTEFPATAGGPAGIYWTSTTYAASPNNAQIFNFGTGRAYAIIDGSKNNLRFTRCVRTGAP